MTQQEQLVKPFGVHEIKWKPITVRNNQALAFAYVDVRAIMDRLDLVFGLAGWESHYTVLDNNSVKCQLRVRLENAWIEKEDVGSPSEQPDEHDRMKAAFSDAMKRAAVQLGIGRYLYRLPQQWVPYDAAKKRFSERPQLPSWAIPEGDKARQPTTQAQKPATQTPPANTRPTRESEPPKATQETKPPTKHKNEMPSNAMELIERLRRKEAYFVNEGVCDPDELMEPFWSKTQDNPQDVADWTPVQIETAAKYAIGLINNMVKRQKAMTAEAK